MSTFERLFNFFSPSSSSSSNQSSVAAAVDAASEHQNYNNSPARHPDIPQLKRKSISNQDQSLDSSIPLEEDNSTQPPKRKRNKYYYQPIELHSQLLSNPLSFITSKKDQLVDSLLSFSVSKVLSNYLPNNPIPLLIDHSHKQQQQQHDERRDYSHQKTLLVDTNITIKGDNPYTVPIRHHHHHHQRYKEKKKPFKNTFKPTIVENNQQPQQHQQQQQQQQKKSERLYHSDSNILNYYNQSQHSHHHHHHHHHLQQQHFRPIEPIIINSYRIHQKQQQQQQQQQQSIMSNDESNNNNNNNNVDGSALTNNTQESKDVDQSFYKPKSRQSFVDILKKEKDTKDFNQSMNQLIQSYGESFSLNEEGREKVYSKPTTQQQLYHSQPLQSHNEPPLTSSPKYSIIHKDDIIDYSSDTFSSFDKYNTTHFKSTDIYDHNTLLSLEDLSNSTQPFTTSTKSPLKQINNNNNNSSGGGGLYKSSNLISSLKPSPTEIEEIEDNKLFASKLEQDKKQSRDEEINSLLSKLQTMSSTQTWRVIQQIQERREIEKRMKPSVRDLTPQENQLYTKIISTSKRGDTTIICQFDDIKLTGNDIITLKPGGWLNDEVVNYYVELLKKRQIDSPDTVLKCHFFNTFFYPLMTNNKNGYQYQRVRKWTAKVDIFSLDLIIAPIHLGNHWCLAVINMRDKRFEYYDSLGGDNYTCLKHLKQWLTDETKEKKKEDVCNPEEFEMYIPKDIPHQLNGYDCGVFTCKFADLHSRGKPLNFTQKDITLFRKLMVIECCNKQLLN